MTSLLRSAALDVRPTSVLYRMMASRASPWSHSSVVESKGDYRHERFLERDDTPLYRYQRTLPRLPVPTLEDTIERFLPTALPLAENDQEVASLHKACQDFLVQAKQLQERLLQRQAELDDSSWLQEWWNTVAYLQYRDPVVIYVSYFFQLADDPTAVTGISRGAAVLKSAAEYCQRVCSGDLPQDVIGKDQTPLCSVAYKYMFHACRIPKPHQDGYRIYEPTRSHAVVACRNQFFAIPVLDDSGNILPLSVLEELLRECEQRAHSAAPLNHLELGWLTTSNRDDWAHARQELLRIGGPTMERALQALESGMLLLCLDDDEPVSYRQRALEYWHGGMRSGGNRWFDKSIQIVVSRNGKLGYIGEHSMMDGMPAVGLCEYLKAQTYQKQRLTGNDALTTSNSGVVNIFEEVSGELTDDDRTQIERLINTAKVDFATLISDHQLHVESFQGYGSTWIKSAGFSPDAFIQVAVQLATYRLFGKQVGTYESTQVRPFLHGRTEATRSVSLASKAFVDAMRLQPRHDEHDKETRARKLEFFRQATQSHVDYIRKAAQGQGVDRHFFGLSMLLENDEKGPSLFSHPLYARSKRWRVSTSTLPNMPGFGEVDTEGVGVAYEIKPTCCKFTVTCRSENDWTDRLCHLLEEALLEIRAIIDMETPPQSKL